jgi:hypothetical protein
VVVQILGLRLAKADISQRRSQKAREGAHTHMHTQRDIEHVVYQRAVEIRNCGGFSRVSLFGNAVSGSANFT